MSCRAHCLPGPTLWQDEEVSWERQARSTLIDSTLTCACYVMSAISIANALDIDIHGGAVQIESTSTLCYHQNTWFLRLIQTHTKLISCLACIFCFRRYATAC